MTVEVKEGRKVLVIGCNAWGKGSTEAVALRNWKRNVPLLSGEVEVAVVDAADESYVDDMGTVITPGGMERPTLIRRRTVKV